MSILGQSNYKPYVLCCLCFSQRLSNRKKEEYETMEKRKEREKEISRE